MIDYSIIAQSIDHYKSYGFVRIESPWTVTKAVSAITKPESAIDYELKHNNKCLVASGEQSFLYLYLKEFLPKGRFQTITPCFRDDQFDTTHTKYFIKNELIVTDEVNQKKLQEVLNYAEWFFKTLLKDEVTVKRISTTEYDIEYRDVELGSYGIRHCDFLSWIYGTGVAEPRLSNLMKQYGIPH